MRLLSILSILSIVASTGAAMADGGSYDISGTTVGKASNEYMPLGGKHLFIKSNTDYTLPDNGTPMAGMNGTCTGNMLVTMGAGAEGSGICTWTDADGDTWYGPWAVNGMTAERAALGTWYVSGGTGKFATATGGGTFVTLTNPDTGDSKLNVLGSVTLK